MDSCGLRRVAAHDVIVDGETLRQCVVELVDGRVVNYYTFTDELPMTEWLGDTIEIRREQDSGLVAYWKNERLH